MSSDIFDINRFMCIMRKEFIEVRRDPVSLRLPLLMPIIFMLLFGYAVTTEVDNISTAVFDQNMTVNSRDYIEKFIISDYFNVNYYVNSEAEMIDLIDSGKAKAGIIIQPDFSEKLKIGKPPQTQLIVDGTDPTTARTAMNSGIIISEHYSLMHKEIYLKTLGISAASLPGANINVRVLYNPGLESRKFTIPALVGLILQNITIMLTAFALVREKERNTIEQLIVSPIKPVELILGKLIPYILIGSVSFFFALSLCVIWFGVGIKGSLLLLIALGLLFVLCSLSIGMFISTIVRNQLQAMMSLILVILPSILLSGFIFPREVMPPVINFLGYLIPLTYFLDIIRGIVLKGIGAGYLLNDIAALCAFTFIILCVSVLRFKKSLD